MIGKIMPVYWQRNWLNKMIQIIAHRGLWANSEEKNSEDAFKKALIQGFGIETDFRDMMSTLVISHDLPVDGVMQAERFAQICLQYPPDLPIAINIKSDGLHSLVGDFIARAKLKNYFVFDMSIPDSLGYIRQGIPFYTRMSEFELKPALLNEAKGIWLDCFESDWYGPEVLNRYLELGKKIAIVSPELHRRSHQKIWNMLKKYKFHLNPLLSICTDFPIQAREFFSAED